MPGIADDIFAGPVAPSAPNSMRFALPDGVTPAVSVNGGAYTALGGAGFSSDVLVPMPNGSSVTVTAAELITAISGVTGSEVSSFLIKLFRAGAQISALKIDSETGLTIVVDKLSPAAMLTLNASNASSTTNGIKFQTQGGDRGIITCDVSGHLQAQSDGFFDVSNLAGNTHYFRVSAAQILCLGSRFYTARGASIPAATTITLGADGNMFPITVGTGTINSITAPALPGFDAILDCVGGVTITHNVAGSGATILTSSTASIVTPAGGRAVRVCYNGTNWLAQA